MNYNLHTSIKLYCYDVTRYPTIETHQKTGNLADDHEQDPKMPADYYTKHVYIFI